MLDERKTDSAACPCALGVATPMSIVVGERWAQAGVLIKNASAAGCSPVDEQAAFCDGLLARLQIAYDFDELAVRETGLIRRSSIDLSLRATHTRTWSPS